MNDNFDPHTSIPTPSPDVVELNKRRNLIKALYQEVLGRDADINGLSYYTVHKEISADEIRRQMTQSIDHKDAIVRSQKYPELEKKCIELEDHVLKLQNTVAENERLITHLRAVTSGVQPQGYTNTSYAQDLQQDIVPPAQVTQDNANLINITQLAYPKKKGFMSKIKGFFGQ